MTFLARLRHQGARKLAIWKGAFWALDHYPGFAECLRSTGRQLVATPEVLVFDLETHRS